MELVKDMKGNLKCGDCGVKPGKPHKPGCDVERCPKCGGQLISCDCFRITGKMNEDGEEYFDIVEFSKYEPEIWTGIMYEKEKLYCEKHNLYCYWGPDFGEKGWVRCDINHPGAIHDLNTAIPQMRQT